MANTIQLVEVVEKFLKKRASFDELRAAFAAATFGGAAAAVVEYHHKKGEARLVEVARLGDEQERPSGLVPFAVAVNGPDCCDSGVESSAREFFPESSWEIAWRPLAWVGKLFRVDVFHKMVGRKEWVDIYESTSEIRDILVKDGTAIPLSEAVSSGWEMGNYYVTRYR